MCAQRRTGCLEWSGELWCIEVRTFWQGCTRAWWGRTWSTACRLGHRTMWRTGRGWKGSSIGLREWCRGWRAWSMEGDWKGWICWHWRREETVLIWSNCSRFRRDCRPFHGTRSESTVRKEQGATQRSWSREVLDGTSESTFFRSGLSTDGTVWVRRWFRPGRWRLSRRNWRNSERRRRTCLWTNVRLVLGRSRSTLVRPNQVINQVIKPWVVEIP